MTPEENHLEQTLRLAANEPAHRPDFYTALLESTIYVLSGAERVLETTRTVQAGEKLSIESWTRNDGTPIIPIFSSLTALQRAIDKECGYAALPARTLLEMTKGATLVLNPRSEFGKEFLPHEIEALLASGVNYLAERNVVQKATQVLLGQPKDYPSEMVASLTSFLKTRKNAKAAYLALMHQPFQDEKPHLVVGIEADRDVEQIIRQAGVVASDSSPRGEVVDLMRVVPGDKGLSDYFRREVKPFYRRHWGESLKAILRMGRA